MEIQTTLTIIGAGASGLMAACAAAEAGLDCLLVERRHRPGLKMLLCGNNRCNISHAGTPESMKEAYGDPVGAFLEPALKYFPPLRLKAWFEARQLPVTLLKDRYYPRSEKADDVLHVFTDFLRDKEVPVMFNCPVTAVESLPGGGFLLKCPALTIRTDTVIVATGGASYPKTGSVGDGQRFAESLGHTVEPLRPGLVGAETDTSWLVIDNPKTERNIPSVKITVCQNERKLAVIGGNLLADGSCLRGSALFDTMRFIARNRLESFTLQLDVFPDTSMGEIASRIQKFGSLYHALNSLGLECTLAERLARNVQAYKDATQTAAALKRLPLSITEIHPLKEAIVTVGGVSLDEIEPETLQSRLVPGLFFTGEVLDIDGPTGGFNLHAAFATGRLAINGICRKFGARLHQDDAPKRPASSSHTSRPVRRFEDSQPRSNGQEQAEPRPRRGESKPRNPKSAWGKDFWSNAYRRHGNR